MQLLVSKCPYCARTVETTLDHVEEPIVCNHCHRPFEMEIPRVDVTSVREVDDQSYDEEELASEPRERTIEVVHPAVFRAHLLGSAIMIPIALASASLGVMALFGSISGWFGIAGIFGLIICAAMAGYWYIDSLATTLTITSSRTLVRRGIIRKDTSEVQHDDVRNIQIDQNILHRLLNIGAIGISSAGQSDLEVYVRGLPDPEHLVEIIRRNQI